MHTPLETPALEVLKKRGLQFTGSHGFQGSYQVLIPRGVVEHGVVGVHLLQPRQQTLHQAVAIRELNELEGHLAPDADNDGVRQQTRVLHLLNAHDLLQTITHTEAQQERRRAGVSLHVRKISRERRQNPVTAIRNWYEVRKYGTRHMHHGAKWEQLKCPWRDERVNG